MSSNPSGGYVKVTTCKCVKSKCLMLYCECYRQGITCNDDCMCIDCKNTKDRANYKKKDGGTSNGSTKLVFHNAGKEMSVVEGRHGRYVRAPKMKMDALQAKQGSGCACKNSKCLKKYCVCYDAGLECTIGRCKCVNCKNPNGAIKKYPKPSPSRRAGAADVSSSSLRVRTAENTKCKCSKTNCLKLYCDCFRQDLACNDRCTCVECKNNDDHGGPSGERSEAKKHIMKTRPHAFKTPKKKSGGGCSCLKNKCRSKYCDCNARGVGCDPAVCGCINCENMMRPLSEMPEHELRRVAENDTVVFDTKDFDKDCKVRGLRNYSHLINDFEDNRLGDPSGRLRIDYACRENAAEAALTVMEKESMERGRLRDEINQLESQLDSKIRREHEAWENYRQKSNKVMCLEMEEPCRWNDTFNRLKQYVAKTGDLPPVPSACASEPDRRLSIWVQEMKSLVYSKSERITNFPHRVEALEALGIEWITSSSEEQWNKMYDRLAAYKRKHKTVRLPSFMQCRKSKNKDLSTLRHWLDLQEADVKTGEIGKRRDRLKKLQNLGLPLKLTWEQEWDHFVVELLKFRSKYGHLVVSGSNDYSDLIEFQGEVLDRLRWGSEVKLTQDEKLDLGSKGLLNDLKALSQGKTTTTDQQAESMKLVPLDRVMEANYWTQMLAQLKGYHAKTGLLDFSPPGPGKKKRKFNNGRGIGDYAHLREWVAAQRKAFKNKTMEQSRIDALEELGFEFDPFETMYEQLVEFKKEGGTARLPKIYKSDGTELDNEVEALTKWLQEHIKLYRAGKLDSDKKKKLRKLGVVFTKGRMGKVPWEVRFDEMVTYYRKHKTCLPKRDGPLRQWVVELVDLIENGYVSNKRQRLLDDEAIEPHLRPEIIFKKSGGVPPTIKRKAAELSTGDGDEGDDDVDVDVDSGDENPDEEEVETTAV